MKMKKVAALLVSSLMVLSVFAGCGSSKDIRTVPMWEPSFADHFGKISGGSPRSGFYH